MRRFVTVLLLVVVVGFLGGCSSRNNSAPGVPEVGDDVGRGGAGHQLRYQG